jgi:hypothetical protein
VCPTFDQPALGFNAQVKQDYQKLFVRGICKKSEISLSCVFSWFIVNIDKKWLDCGDENEFPLDAILVLAFVQGRR